MIQIPWKTEYCLYGIRCIRTTFVMAIAVMSVISVYNLLSLHSRRPTSQLLIFNKFPNRNHGNTHHDEVFRKDHNVSKTKFTTHRSTKHPMRLQARTKYKKTEPATKQRVQNQPVESERHSEDQPVESERHSEHRHGSKKMILWHMIPKYRKHGPDSVINCGNHKCIKSSNRSRLAKADAIIVDAFLLSRNRIKEKPVRTNPNQVWIFFTKEPWANYEVQFPKKNFDTIFNWTMTYQRDSDFVTSYGGVVPKSKDKMENYDWENILKMKTQSVFWLVSNCNAGSKRHKYVEQLQKYIDVDVVGKCGRRTCLRTANVTKDDTDPCYAQSRFYLAFESRFCQDYVTEKFFRTFNHHIIPIVRGKANYSNLCPSDLYINTADFQSPQNLAEYLKYLERNTTAYLGYLKRRAQYRAINTGFRECEICTHLHHLDMHRKSYSSISDWIGRCETPQEPHLH